MDHIKNLKYLKSNDIHFYVGWIPLVLGIILFVLGELFWVYLLPFQFLFSIGFAILGAVIVFLPSSLRSKEEDLDLAVKTYMDELSKNTVQSLEKKLKDPYEAPTVLGRYLLEGEGIIVRKSRRDQKYRSSLYSGTIIAFKKESVCIIQNTLSLISDQMSQKLSDIPYTNKPTARVEERTTNFKTQSGVLKKEHELVICDADGNEIRIPINNSMMIDELCEKLDKEVKRSVS